MTDATEVAICNGALALRQSDGTLKPVTINDRPVPAPRDGWRVVGAYEGFVPFTVLDLVNGRGESAWWVLDDAACVIGGDSAPLSQAKGADFAQAVGARMSLWGRDLLCRSSGPRAPDLEKFFRLGRSVRRDLQARAQFPAEPAPTVVDLATTADMSWRCDLPDGGAVVLGKDDVMRVLHVTLTTRFVECCKDGSLSWPHLADDEMDRNAHCVFLEFDHALVRCVDASGLVYFVALWGAELLPVAVIVPQAGLVFGYSLGAQALYLRGPLAIDPGAVMRAYVAHVLRASSDILRWLDGRTNGAACFMWPGKLAHIGHFLWNEASGLEAIVEQVPRDSLPVIFNLPARDNYQFYAPLSVLYPEFSGRIDDSIADFDAMLDACYARGLQPIRPSGHYVSAAVRERVMHAVRTDPDVQLISAMGGPLLASHMPVLVLSLRLSDRTHDDLGGFYCRVVERLLRQVSELTVVVDGLNTRPGQAPGTAFPIVADRSRPVNDLFSREKAVVERLRKEMAGRPVHIVDCVGTSMRVNLFWIDRGWMFVSPWGAGLVKTRWICNKVGFVFSSRRNLTQPHQLPIYHLPMYMETPAPIVFVDPDRVHDLPPSAKADGGPGALAGVNFTFDEEPVLARIAALFSDVMVERRPQWRRAVS